MTSMKSVQQGAATTVWAAIGAELEGRGGRYLENVSVSRPMAEGGIPFSTELVTCPTRVQSGG